MSPRSLALLLIPLAVAGCGRTAPYWYTPDGGEDPFIAPTITEPFKGCNLNELVKHPLPPSTKRPIDVLFVIDDSPSMADDQATVASNFASFISSFQSEQVDFHLGAVTTDMRAAIRKGALVGPYLTPTTPNLEEAFKTMVNVGDKGSAREEGIAAAMAALTEPLSTGANLGFIRADADFAIIWLTDENDSSPQTATQAIDFFKNFKPDAEAVTVAAILDFGGNLFCGLGAASWKYAQVVNAFGAHGVLAICSTGYSRTLATIGGRIVKARCIIGIKRAITDFAKVRVTVNGANMPYTYIPPDTLYPNGSIELETCPAGGGTLEIEYLDCP